MKYIISRKIIFISLILIVVSTLSCDEDLLVQTNPNSMTPESYWRDATDAKKGIIACYEPFSHIWYYSRCHIFTTDYRDDVVNGYATSERTDPGRFEGGSERNMNKWMYQAMWMCIVRANELLAVIDDVPMDANLRNNIKGEAYFIRAFNYFHAVTTWLNVPLLTEPLIDVSAVVQADPADVWNQIVADLQEAQKLCPASWSGDDLGRVTSGAATAMLGKTHLYRATLLEGANANQEFTSASSEFRKIMGGQYSLVSNYAYNFDPYQENNEESIFEIQLVKDENVGWGGTGLGIGRTNSFTPDIAPQGFTGQDGMRCNDWILDLFTDEQTINGEIDPRAFNTIFWRTDETTTYQDSVHASTIYLGQPYDSVFDASTDHVWGKKYLGLNELINGTALVSTANFQESANNFRAIRYADVLLMFAEAELLANNGTISADGLAAINEVRTRVDMPDLPANLTMKDIEDERIKELTFERTRYYDLLRWGQVKTRIADNPEFKSESGGTGAYQPGREYLDIPAADLNQNANFKHNPGY